MSLRAEARSAGWLSFIMILSRDSFTLFGLSD